MAATFFNYLAPALIILLCLVAIGYLKIRKFSARDARGSRDPQNTSELQDDLQEPRGGDWEPSWIKGWSD